ncbi:hypothetical protein Tco_1452826, partial [Tanacetum coccineum]
MPKSNNDKEDNKSFKRTARISVRACCFVNPPLASPPYHHFSPPTDYLTAPPSTPLESPPTSHMASPGFSLEPVELIFFTPPISPYLFFDSLKDLPPQTTNPPPPQPSFDSIEHLANQPPPLLEELVSFKYEGQYLLDKEPPEPAAQWLVFLSILTIGFI